MGKLELKHLAPYLPYNLTCANGVVKYPGNKNFEPRIDNITGFFNDCGHVGIILNEDEACLNSSLEDTNPILRPLSDLTKEIEVNEEKFVPLIEIAKLTEPDFKWLIEDDHAFCNMVGDDYYEFWYDKLLQTFRFELVITDSDSVIKYPNSQIDCFNKLFEWHFDVFNLIEKGLAIDINTLNN